MKRWGLPLLIVVLVGGLVLLFWLGNRSTTPAPTANSAATVRASSDGLPGLLTGNQPWAANNDANLVARLTAINLPQLAAEGTVLHIHQHLDIYVNGQSVAVPAQIGIPASQAYISPIHVHDTTGIIHVESPQQQDFYLGQFFDIWGVKFSSTCVGGYCASGDQQLAVYVNGQKASGDPRQIKLAAHQEIVVVYGTAAQLPNSLPAMFNFPSGD